MPNGHGDHGHADCHPYEFKWTYRVDEYRDLYSAHLTKVIPQDSTLRNFTMCLQAQKLYISADNNDKLLLSLDLINQAIAETTHSNQYLPYFYNLKACIILAIIIYNNRAFDYPIDYSKFPCDDCADKYQQINIKNVLSCLADAARFSAQNNNLPWQIHLNYARALRLINADNREALQTAYRYSYCQKEPDGLDFIEKLSELDLDVLPKEILKGHYSKFSRTVAKPTAFFVYRKVDEVRQVAVAAETLECGVTYDAELVKERRLEIWDCKKTVAPEKPSDQGEEPWHCRRYLTPLA